MNRVRNNRVRWVLLIAALAVICSAFVTPGVRHSHSGGGNHHSHAHNHSHAHDHPHSHSHSHPHPHTHFNAGHQPDDAEIESSTATELASHTHFSIFGFSLTLWDSAAPDGGSGSAEEDDVQFVRAEPGAQQNPSVESEFGLKLTSELTHVTLLQLLILSETILPQKTTLAEPGQNDLTFVTVTLNDGRRRAAPATPPPEQTKNELTDCCAHNCCAAGTLDSLLFYVSKQDYVHST